MCPHWSSAVAEEGLGAGLSIAVGDRRRLTAAGGGWLQRHAVARWELVVSAAALAGAATAIVVTARADFLAHPGWLAVQKADFILGPVAVGLYWRRRRPRSRFGPLLIGFGFLQLVYILQSSSTSFWFSVGVVWEVAIYVGTLTLILTFPTGRLDRPSRLILAAVAVATIPYFVYIAVSPVIPADGAISGCRDACPANALQLFSRSSWVRLLVDIYRTEIVVVALVTAALLVMRFTTGSTPRRRAFAVGAPVAVVFLISQALFQSMNVFSPDMHSSLHTFVRWTFVGTRAAIWYGFWLALIVAELFAGRVLSEPRSSR